jgi:uncharacterized protein YcnI
VRHRKIFGTAGAAALLVAVAGPVSAHVTVHSVEAFQGATDAEIVFRVPNEEDKANTTKVEIDLPLDTPVIGVAVEPPPGWTAAITESNLPKPVHTDDGDETTAVTKVVFSGGKIAPDDYLDFPISADQLPSAPQIVFKAIQTYSDGTVVRWIDQAAPGGPEPDHPAPTLALPAAAPGGAVSGSTASPPTSLPSPVTPQIPSAAAPPTGGVPNNSELQAVNAQLANKADKNRTNLALGLGIAGLVIGLLGVAAGASALRRR